MGLVLAAPADLLPPLVETPQAAPDQSVPADGLFASLLASLSAMGEGEASETTVETLEIPGAPGDDAESADKSDSDPFAALMSMSVALPVVQLATEQPHREWTVSQGTDQIAGVHERSNGIETNHELSEEITHAMAAKPGAAIEAGTSMPTEATVADATEQPSAAVAASVATPTEAPETSRQIQATTRSGDKPEGVKPAESAPAGDANVGDETPGVVRSVGNAESTETPDRDTTGNGNPGKESVDRPLPRASVRGVQHASGNSAVAQLRAPEASAPADAVVELPTEAPAAADVPPQVEQVAQTVIESVETGGGEARIHLDPAGLGEVTIHVRTERDHVRVEIHAERHEAMQLLKDHTQDLSNLLGQRGLNLSDVNVGLGRGNGDQAWGRGENGNRNTTGNEFASILGIDEPAAMDTHNRLRAAYNPDGALVYRV